MNDKTILTEYILMDICKDAEEWELIRELSYLDLEADILWKPFELLSNGEQTKVLLAALFLNEGHFLLIDEPTNHLDARARKKVAEYLKKKKGFILVSHDRSFLDECIDHVLSINRATIEIQKGNFSSWIENFNKQQDFETRQNLKLKKDITRLKQSARQISVWSDTVEKSKNRTLNSGPKLDKGYIGHKSAKLMKRSKNIEKRQYSAIESKSVLLKNIETAENLKIRPLEYHKELLAAFTDIAVIYGEKQICNPVSFKIFNGDRIAIDGKNGSGKSSLLKLLVGDDIKHNGCMNLGSGITISYVPQDTSFLKGKLSDFSIKNGIDESLFKAILRKMDFERVQFEKDIQNFSEGQRKKVMLAKSLCERAHLYVWDEPLNYIDIYSRMQIEHLIKSFKPTMIFVEHDAAFRNAIATEIIDI